jgi:hypothetical protein
VAEPQNIRDQFNEAVASGMFPHNFCPTQSPSPIHHTPAVPRGSFKEYAAGTAASFTACTHGESAIAMAHVMPPCSQILHSTSCAAGNPLMQRIRLDTMVTIVDAGTFIQDYASRVPLAARPDLGEGGNLRPVVDLLVEQIEWVPSNTFDETPEHLIWLAQQ